MWLRTGITIMTKRYATLVLRDDPEITDYVECLWDELQDEKLVQEGLSHQNHDVVLLFYF